MCIYMYVWVTVRGQKVLFLFLLVCVCVYVQRHGTSGRPNREERENKERKEKREKSWSVLSHLHSIARLRSTRGSIRTSKSCVLLQGDPFFSVSHAIATSGDSHEDRGTGRAKAEKRNSVTRFSPVRQGNHFARPKTTFDSTYSIFFSSSLIYYWPRCGTTISRVRSRLLGECTVGRGFPEKEREVHVERRIERKGREIWEGKGARATWIFSTMLL